MSKENKPKKPEGIPPRDFPDRPNPKPSPREPNSYPRKPIKI